MGYDLDRFQNPDLIDEDLKCGICVKVLKDPVETAGCKHVFCKECLENWLRNPSKEKTCPSCRNLMTATGMPNYSSAAEVYLSLNSKLKMKCFFGGCEALSAPENIMGHEKNCIWNPARVVNCVNGCGKRFPRRDQKDHNCVASFRNDFNKEIAALNAENRELKFGYEELQVSIKVMNEERNKDDEEQFEVGADLGLVRQELQEVREELENDNDEVGEVLEELQEKQRNYDLEAIRMSRCFSESTAALKKQIADHRAEFLQQMKSQQAESMKQFKELKNQVTCCAGEEVSLAVSKKRRIEEVDFEKQKNVAQILTSPLTSAVTKFFTWAKAKKSAVSPDQSPHL